MQQISLSDEFTYLNFDPNKAPDVCNLYIALLYFSLLQSRVRTEIAINSPFRHL